MAAAVAAVAQQQLLVPLPGPAHVAPRALVGARHGGRRVDGQRAAHDVGDRAVPPRRRRRGRRGRALPPQLRRGGRRRRRRRRRRAGGGGGGGVAARLLGAVAMMMLVDAAAGVGRLLVEDGACLPEWRRDGANPRTHLDRWSVASLATTTLSD